MSDKSKNELLLELLENAEITIQSAKQLLGGKSSHIKAKKVLEQAASQLNTGVQNGEQIIEGLFDGQNMIGPDKQTYPVPANYASKSKLVEGDKLKLTITGTGSFLYKQIGPIGRKHLVGKLLYDNDGHYKVSVSNRTYNVLLASVTYFKCEIGDDITIVVPESEESQWAAIENKLPPNGSAPTNEQFDLNTF